MQSNRPLRKHNLTYSYSIYILECMKKFGVIGIVCLLVLLCGCEFNKQECYVYIKVDLDKTVNAKLHNNISNSYISVPLDQDIYLSYNTLPERKDYTVLDVSSTNQEVITIKSVDYDKKEIIAHTLSFGSAKIKIKTDNCYSSITLLLQVE